MPDAHDHRDGYATFLSLRDREFRFYGVHPWEAARAGRAPYQGDECAAAASARRPYQDGECAADASARRPYQDGEFVAELRAALEADAHSGVGEIGLDRLKVKTIPSEQRVVFAAQLEIAAEFHRPVVLHGAKCWGEVVAACRPYAGRIPSFLFHGFSRSGGLLPDIAALNGFVGVGAALLNDHAVNYRALVKEIPLERLLLETDADYASSLKRQECRFPDGRSHIGEAALSPLSPTPGEILAKLAEIRGMRPEMLEATVDANAARFVEVLA